MTQPAAIHEKELLEIIYRADLLASAQGLDRAEAARLAAISICNVQPDWEMHRALQFVWQHRP